MIYNETLENYYDFGGIWDPSIFLAGSFIKTLQEKFNVASFPLWEKLDQETYRKLVAECEAAYNAARETDKADAHFGISSSFNEFINKTPYKYLNASPLESIRLLREVLDTDLIFELSISNILIYRSSGGLYTSLSVFGYGRLIRLSDGAVLWLSKADGGTRIKSFKDFSELERNNLELLKEYYEEAIRDFLNINRSALCCLGGGASPFLFKGLFID